MPSRRLVSFEIRSTPLIGFIPAGVVALVLGIVAGRQPTGAEFRYLPLRLAIVSLVCAVAFVFDDPAKTFTDPAPSPLHIRRSIRALVGTMAASCLLVVALIPASRDMDVVATANQPRAGGFEAEEEAQTELPWGRPALEMATMIGLTLSIAGAAARHGQPEPGRITSGIVLVVYALSWMIPDSYRPWAAPLDQRWANGARWWWAALIVVWVSALTISWDSRVSESLLQRTTPHHLASR
jgi:hypothetical protein